MDLSNIKKIVLEEGKLILLDNNDALVIMSFDEYKKIKTQVKSESQISKVIPADPVQTAVQEMKAENLVESETPGKIDSELTLDDLPF